MSDRICLTCLAFDWTDVPAGIGVCRRYAPRHVALETVPVHGSSFPAVTESDRCLEWIPDDSEVDDA